MKQGILGANPGNPYGVTGIAYGALLTAYKVFGCNGPTNDISECISFISETRSKDPESYHGRANAVVEGRT